jgi:hypothetical protein
MVVVFAMNADKVEVGENASALCILDIASVRALAGDISDETVSGLMGSRCSSRAVNSEIRRAGFGDVLKVEPRDVYLSKAGQQRTDRFSLYIPLVIQTAVGNVEITKECPNIGIRPINDWVHALELRPTRISHSAMGEPC